jgi:predicted TIM-barrel fold metal-dependent hydrolase
LNYLLQGEEMMMQTKRVSLVAGGALTAIFVQTAAAPLHAEAQTASALSGQVTSAEEGPMEGVAPIAQALIEVNSDRILWGTD